MKVTKIYVVRVQARDEWGSRNLDEAFSNLKRHRSLLKVVATIQSSLAHIIMNHQNIDIILIN